MARAGGGGAYALKAPASKRRVGADVLLSVILLVKPEQVPGDIDVGAIAEVVLQRFDALKHSLAVRVVLTPWACRPRMDRR